MVCANAAAGEAALPTRADRLTGRLVLCPTPIGNLADITLRALEELRGADLILAEDTRHTGGLLRHYGIQRPMLSYHDHNEAQRLPAALERLKAGQRLVLVSDAGTPGLADPGFRLVRAATAAGVPVTALPGPNAVLPALTLSGLPTHGFAFYGFVPRGASERATAFQSALAFPLTGVWYESPHRLVATLNALRDLGFGQRPGAVARELTKLHEEVVRGTVADLAARFAAASPVGEIVLMVGPGDEKSPASSIDALAEVIRRRAEGESVSRAVAAVAAEYGISRRVLYSQVLAEERDREAGASPPRTEPD